MNQPPGQIIFHQYSVWKIFIERNHHQRMKCTLHPSKPSAHLGRWWGIPAAVPENFQTVWTIFTAFGKDRETTIRSAIMCPTHHSWRTSNDTIRSAQAFNKPYGCSSASLPEEEALRKIIIFIPSQLFPTMGGMDPVPKLGDKFPQAEPSAVQCFVKFQETVHILSVVDALGLRILPFDTRLWGGGAQT